MVGVEIAGEVMAYPFTAVAAMGAINDEVGEHAIVVLYKAGTASALDQRTSSASRDVGSVAVFERVLDGQTFTIFTADDGTFAGRYFY